MFHDTLVSYSPLCNSYWFSLSCHTAEGNIARPHKLYHDMSASQTQLCLTPVREENNNMMKKIKNSCTGVFNPVFLSVSL